MNEYTPPQRCTNNSDADLLQVDCHKVDNTNPVICYFMAVSVLLEEPCNTSDSSIKLLQIVNSLYQTYSYTLRQAMGIQLAVA